MRKKKNDNEKINKSKEIIKKEKEKIKEEKKKQKKEKKQKFYQTKVGKFVKKISPAEDELVKAPTLMEQIISMLFFEIIGAVLCLLVLFILSGGENYLKLYKELSKLISVYDTITTEYYGEYDKDELIDDAIESMLNAVGDSYTTYSDEETTISFNESINGTYEGIGCTISMNENSEIYIVSIYEDSPAEEAGLQVGDIILTIDGEDYTAKTSDDMSEYVKSSENSEIKVTVKRDEQELEFTIKRDTVEIPCVTSEVLEINDKKVGYISISIFSSVAAEQFKTNLEKLEDNDIEGLIIDVRGNSGGYLSTATDIISMFLEKGDVIYQLESSDKTEKVKDTTKESRSYPVAVLVNVASASASEILAAAIKESYGGYVVGTNTYGKGTVQQTKQLSDGTMIKYTIQNWLTPNGTWVNETGLTPTNYVLLDSESETDNQLQTALELIADDLS